MSDPVILGILTCKFFPDLLNNIVKKTLTMIKERSSRIIGTSSWKVGADLLNNIIKKILPINTCIPSENIVYYCGISILNVSNVKLENWHRFSE